MYIIVIVTIFTSILSMIYIPYKRKTKWSDPLKKLFKEQRKSAKRNRIKGIKYVICEGDSGKEIKKFGRYYGSVEDRRVKQIFVKGVFHRLWLIVPNELCRDSLSKNYYVKCLGFRRVDLIWVPLLTKKHMGEHKKYESRVNVYVEKLMNDLLDLEFNGIQVTASIEATKTSEKTPQRFIRRGLEEDEDRMQGRSDYEDD